MKPELSLGMKPRLPIIRLFLLALILSVSVPAAPANADEYLRFTLETRMLSRINEARANPLQTAQSFGLDGQHLLDSFPELQQIFQDGLPPLHFNAKLRESARAHGRDMLEQDFFGKISLDDRAPEERIAATGYLAEATGETLGILGFFNFIPPAEAVDKIFKELFLQELDPQHGGERLILSDSFKEVGIGFDGGPMTLNGLRHNVYLFVCDFAKSRISSLELSFLNLINQARRAPLKMAARLGLEPEKVLSELPELAELLREGMPPLAFDERLYVAARAHAEDMLKNDFFAATALDGRSPWDRARQAGYNGERVLESKRLFSGVDPIFDVEETAWFNFQRMFLRELNPHWAPRTILNPELKDVGVGIVTPSPSYWRERGIENLYSQYHTQIVVSEFGIPQGPKADTRLIGNFFVDWDQDGLSRLEETVPGVPVAILAGGQANYLLSDRSGGFSLPLPATGVEVSPLVEASPVTYRGTPDGRNHLWAGFELFKQNPDEPVR